MQINNDRLPIEALNEIARMRSLALLYLEANNIPMLLASTATPAALGDIDSILWRLEALYATGQDAEGVELLKLAINGTDDATFCRALLQAAPSFLFRTENYSGAFAALSEYFRPSNMHPSLPYWNGEDLTEKTLVVWFAYQGFGDDIMYSRFLPMLAERGATVVVQCRKEMARLFYGLPGVDSVIPIEVVPECDYAVPIQGVPHALGVSHIPPSPFKKAGKGQPGDSHYRVGITWGASWILVKNDRACALSELLPVAHIPNVQLHSLQTGPYAKQLNPPPEGMNVIDDTHALADFADTADAIASMDAVVTTDNVIANLAGAMGKPTFVLVPIPTDFRWSNEHSPWYPSARIYRQTMRGEWGDPIRRLTEDLALFLPTTRV